MSKLDSIHDSIQNFRCEDYYEPNDMLKLLAILEMIVMEIKRIESNQPKGPP